MKHVVIVVDGLEVSATIYSDPLDAFFWQQQEVIRVATNRGLLDAEIGYGLNDKAVTDAYDALVCDFPEVTIQTVEAMEL